MKTKPRLIALITFFLLLVFVYLRPDFWPTLLLFVLMVGMYICDDYVLAIDIKKKTDCWTTAKSIEIQLIGENLSVKIEEKKGFRTFSRNAVKKFDIQKTKLIIEFINGTTEEVELNNNRG
jgi:hypothetical protein